eukprot:12828803-Alexandrium_andersonii.AAC.1
MLERRRVSHPRRRRRADGCIAGGGGHSSMHRRETGYSPFGMPRTVLPSRPSRTAAPPVMRRRRVKWRFRRTTGARSAR